MSIRFHCPFCDQLLGSVGRPAGSVIQCPACHGHVGVPLPLAHAPDAIVLGPVRLIGLALGLLLLAGLAFVAGLLVGSLG